MLLFCAKNIVKESRKFELARLKKKEERKKNISLVLRVPGLVHLRCFLAPLGVLLVMKTLEDEWYVVIKAKLAVFEILGDFLYCHILRVRAIHTLESTDSMIITRIKNIKNVTRCRDSRSAKSIETR